MNLYKQFKDRKPDLVASPGLILTINESAKIYS